MGKEYKHISLQERDMMAVYKAKRLNPSQIAEKLGRHRSTICREPFAERAGWFYIALKEFLISF